MKKGITLLCFVALGLLARPVPVLAQAQEIEQLLLNVEKLTQLKKILQNMYDGYKIISKGYNAIKDISQGNFSLHKVFLDALLEVSPTVKKYKRVADIINCQIRIVKEYKAAYQRFSQDGNFTVKEIVYIGKVYENLFNESLKKLDELLMVITANQLRMSDDERLGAIDRIFAEVEDQLLFLRDFNNGAFVLSKQRKNESDNISVEEKLYGIER